MKQLGFYIFCSCVAVFGFSLAIIALIAYQPISYYATLENGDTFKVDTITAYPISSVEQISRMWPEYHIETTVDFEGREITLRSRPFLFCDDPEIEGSYAGRDVYWLKGE
jgi:hypothetical protein